MIVPTSVFQIYMILKNLTPEIYLVGGCVRDHLMGIEPKDYDIVVNGCSYEEMKEALETAGWNVKETGKNFLVLNVSKYIGEEYHSFEIALFRKESDYTDGRHPNVVSIGSIEEDALRRDFTINSVYFNLSTGEYVDPTGKGIKDIKERILRFNGRTKERIEEDYLRLFRALRFLKKYNLKWASRRDQRTFRRLFIEHANKVNPQRMLNELEKC